MSSAKAFNLDRSESLSFGNELMTNLPNCLERTSLIWLMRWLVHVLGFSTRLKVNEYHNLPV